MNKVCPHRWPVDLDTYRFQNLEAWLRRDTEAFRDLRTAHRKSMMRLLLASL
jgi:hypothetical protein